ncbi:MAG: OmpH family outer membrane protein [Candidatus Dasytiphilus stammeri]
MKKFLSVILLLIVCTMGYSYFTSIAAYPTIVNDKIAIINLPKIFEQIPQVQVISQKLDEEFKDRANTIQNMELNLQKNLQHLQYNGYVMNSIEHTKLEQEIILQREKLVNEIQSFENDRQHRQSEEQQKLLVIIKDIVRKIALHENYEMVFDADAIIYAHHFNNMTEQVIKTMISK